MIGVFFALISSLVLSNPAYDFTNALRLQYAGHITTSCAIDSDTLYTLDFDLTFDSQLNYDDSTTYNIYFTEVSCNLNIYDIDGTTVLYTGSLISVPPSEYIQNPYNHLIFTISSAGDDTVTLVGKISSDTICTFVFDTNGAVDFEYAILSGAQYDWFLSNYISQAVGLIDTGNVYYSGLQDGYTQGYDVGYGDGFSDGKHQGYIEGVQYAQSQDQTALTIFTGICTVAMLPVNMFLTIFNFEVFGINIGGFISSFLTIAIVVIIIRMITGKKSDD